MPTERLWATVNKQHHTLHGQSRAATPVARPLGGTLARRQGVIPYFWDADVDGATTTHGAFIPTEGEAGDLGITFLGFRSTDSGPVVTSGDPEWTVRLTSLVSPLSSPWRALYDYDRTLTNDSNDALTWTWTATAKAAAITVVIPGPRTVIDRDFDSTNASTVTITPTGSGGQGSAVLIAVWSETGASVVGATSVFDMGPIWIPGGWDDPAAFGRLQVWLLFGTVNSFAVTADSGNVLFTRFITIQ